MFISARALLDAYEYQYWQQMCPRRVSDFDLEAITHWKNNNLAAATTVVAAAAAGPKILCTLAK